MTTTSARRPGRRQRIKNWLRGLAVRAICLAGASVGLMARPFSRRAKDYDPRETGKILVLRLDLLGDLVLTMPAIQAIRDAYPTAKIDVLSLPYTAPLLDHYPFVGKLLGFDVNRLRPSGEMLKLAPYVELVGLLRKLRRERYDLAISFHGIWGSMLAFASGAAFRAGYRDESCPFMLNLAIPGKRYRVNRHEADYCLDLALACGARQGDYGLSLFPLPEANPAVDEFLKRHGVGGDGLLIALHVGATNGAAKRWTDEGMAALADRLVDEEGATVIFTGSKGDLPDIERIGRLMVKPAIVAAGATSIAGLIALLARCRLLIGGDTGPMHLAVALGIPVVAIHGPTDPRLSGPYGGKAIVVRREMPCGPCYDLSATADCPRNDPLCMKSITVDEVLAAARRQLLAYSEEKVLEPQMNADERR